MLAFHAPPEAVTRPVIRIGEDAGEDDGHPAFAKVEAEDAGDIAQVAGNGEGSGDDVEEDVPLGSEEHEQDGADVNPPPILMRARRRMGNSAVAGTEAAICARG